MSSTEPISRHPEPFFVVGAISQYLGAAVAVGLFDELDPATVALVRVAAAAGIIVAIRRSWRRDWSREELAWTVAFGVALASMNLSIYFAIDELPLGNVDTRRDYIFTGDMARALRMLVDGPEGSFTVNLGTGRSWTAREMVANLGELLGRELVIATDPAKVRVSDRPVLQASTRRLQMLLPELEITDLREALRATLVGEGFSLATPARV